MKPIIQKFWIGVALLCISISTFAYDFSVNGIYYTKLSDGFSVEVSNKSTRTYAKSSYSGDVVIPGTVVYDDLSYNVTSVGQFAFYNSDVTSVELPDGITSLGNNCFEKSASMTSCVLPETITAIGSAAFSGCVSLQKINIPKGVSTLNLETFYGCNSITEVTIPNTIMKIAYASTTWASSGTGALNAHAYFPCFGNCKALKSVIFEDGDRPISFIDATPGFTTPHGVLYANEIFYGCPLTSVYLGRTLEDSPSNGLFQNFPTLTNVEIGSYVKSIQNYAFRDCKGISTISIPSNVTKIGRSSFDNCTNLTSAFIGDGLNTLPYGTFASCTNLEEVYIGNGLKNIDSDAFYNCTKLKTVLLCSSQLESIRNSNIPSHITFFVPKRESYTVVLNGFSIMNIGTIYGGEFEYTGVTPLLTIVPSLETISLSISDGLSFVNAGIYSEDIPINIAYSSKWGSSFQLNADFSISKAPLTVIANDVSRKYGMENPELICSFFGFKNGETKEVLTRMPNVETTATVSSNTGAYPIIPTGGEAQNYTFNYERGTLTITKADQTIEWEQQFGTVNVGDVIELNATSSAELPVKYASTDETIAEIFTQGGKKYVEFLKPGNVSLRATQEGNENYNEADRVSKSVKVDLLISSITLNQNSVTLAEGNSLQLTATVAPSNASNKTLAWESANPEIATVDTNGKVNALKQGSTLITVKSTDGSNISVSCTINVVKLVSEIILNETELILNEGATSQLTAILSADANNPSLVWTSSNEDVATVSQDGLVTAISKGSAIITAKATDGSNVSASCSVTVVKLVSSIHISDTSIDMKLGEQTTITAHALPADATNPYLRWYSENERIATVENGLVTAVGIGTTYIFVESTDGSNIVEKCEIKVGQPAAIETITSDNISVYLANGIINIANVPINQTAYIFLTNGTLVKSELSTGNLIKFQPSTSGIYIVVINTHRYKVAIK